MLHDFIFSVVIFKAKELMPPLQESNIPDQLKVRPNESNDELKIAWRYQNSPQLDSNKSTSTSSFSQVFDLSQTVSEETLAKADIKYFPESPEKGILSNEKGGTYSFVDTVR